LISHPEGACHARDHDRRQRRRDQRGLRARELDPAAEVTVVVADAYPNFSICGIPYYVSGEVAHWRNLAHRTIADLEAAGMRLRLDTTARASTSPAASSWSPPLTAARNCSATTS
jgi:NADPH-dependent 2,4-dienoyl-CoA reductase/sulfur reductase-like enzyme